VFHVSIWGGLGALFGALSPPKPPVATGLCSWHLRTHFNVYCASGLILRLGAPKGDLQKRQGSKIHHPEGSR